MDLKDARCPIDPWEQFDPAKPRLPSELAAYLSEPVNSVGREKMFNYRLFFDLKLAAAKRNYHLQVFEPDVDRDGYDLVLEDGDVNVKVQLKTVFEATTKQWPIRKRLLRPERHWCEALNFEESPEGEGNQGGVILIMPSVSKEGELTDTAYWYTDVFLIVAACNSLVPGVSVDKKMVHRMDAELRRGPGSETFNLNQKFFVRPNTPESLLALMGLHSRFSSSWRLNVLRYLDTDRKPLPDDERQQWLTQFGREIQENLAQLIHVDQAN